MLGKVTIASTKSSHASQRVASFADLARTLPIPLTPFSLRSQLPLSPGMTQTPIEVTLPTFVLTSFHASMKCDFATDCTSSFTISCSDLCLRQARYRWEALVHTSMLLKFEP